MGKTKKKKFFNQGSVIQALKNGSVIVSLSAVICGLGCIVRKQFVKGFLYLAAEMLVILYMVNAGFYNLRKLVTLGDVEQQKIWNEAKSLYEYVDGDRSLTILLYGVITAAVLLFAFLLIRSSVKSAYAAEVLQKNGKSVPGIRQDVRELLNQNLHKTLLSLFINWKEIRAKKLWRFCFVLTVAVPHFVTLLIIKQMLQPTGAVNVLLQNLGLTDSPLPFFTDAAWARVSVVLINIWVGVPYVLLQITGILQNIPQELYDSARVDGAGPVTVFRKITLPYMLFVTTPYLITSFTGNINNFNVIFLTSGGLPRPVESTAGKTDLLITWLYKLTIEKQYYDVGAVIGIMTFVTLGIVSLITFRFSGSYKNEEGFR